MRVTKLSAAAMLLAGAAFCGWCGAAQAENTHAKVRMVQQSNQNAQQEAQKAQQGAQKAQEEAQKAQQGAQKAQQETQQEAQKAQQQIQQEAQKAQQQGQQQGQMNQMGAAQGAGGATIPQGITPKDLGKTEDARKALSDFTQAALKRDNYKDFVDYFVKADRDRLSSGGNQNMDQWNKAVDNFDQAWKSKYNSNFDVKDRDQAYSDKFLTVQQGTVDNPKSVTHWPVTPMQSQAQTFEQETANPNLQKGTNIAIASLQGTGNEPALTASLIQEGSDWKIDIPDTVNADELKSNIARHLDQVVSMKDQWPSDPNDAARLVTYHILQACYTAGMQGGSSSQSTMGSQGSSSSEQQGAKSESHQGGSTAQPSSSTAGTTSSQSGSTSGNQGEGSEQQE